MNCLPRYIGLAGLLLSVLLAGCTGTFSNPPTAQTTNKAAAAPVGPSAEDAAVKKSLAYLAESDIDTSHHDLSKPQYIDRIAVSGQRGWVVAWGLKNSSGPGQDGLPRLVTLGGQLIVRVWDSGKIDLTYGE